jgi:phosphatidylserine/phosphatidylglycerophosphate/cardiolipin synthase-like enzyme
MRESLCRGSQIRCELDTKERPMHCHHEKTIVIDDRIAFVGGIDLTSEGGDRFDSSAHPARSGVGWRLPAPDRRLTLGRPLCARSVS